MVYCSFFHSIYCIMCLFISTCKVKEFLYCPRGNYDNVCVCVWVWGCVVCAWFISKYDRSCRKPDAGMKTDGTICLGFTHSNGCTNTQRGLTPRIEG